MLERLLAGEQFAFHIERRGVGGGAAQLNHAVLGARDRHSPALLVAGGQAGLPFELGVQLRRVLDQACCALRSPELTDQPGGVPGCAAGELALFNEQDVG